MRSFLCFTIFGLLMASCCDEKVINYEFNSIAITRIDNCGESYICYGRIREIKDIPLENLKIEYYGFDGCMDAYLMFNSDSTVTIIGTSGSYKSHLVNSDKIKFIRYMGFDENFKLIDSIIKNYDTLDNVIRITDRLESEKNFYKKKKSILKITPTYN
jgi:hypothetical protein